MNNNKFFLITIDTEADNQWDLNHKCSTENSRYLPRFQRLAEKYDYKPVWLTTYEMANDDYYVTYFKNKQDKGLCEIGMHLHAWNTPPDYKLESKSKARPFLIEYPIEIMEEKIRNLDNLLKEKFDKKIVSHRAGRWAMNSEYFELLKKYKYKIDCSVTPHIDWKKSVGVTGMPGSNYFNEVESQIYKNGILEIPVTIKKIRIIQFSQIKSLKKLLKELKLFITGRYQWIRPDKSFSTKGIKKVIDKCNRDGEYIMFMIHSSELMPGGSPNFVTKEDIEKLYDEMEYIFKYSKDLGYSGITLKEFYERVKE